LNTPTLRVSSPVSHSTHASPQDRLVTAIFIAVIFHLIVLLGVGFSASASHHTGEVSSLEVILVHDPVSDAERNEQADYLAEVNQRGAGTGAEIQHAQAPGGAPLAGAGGRSSGGADHTSGSADDDLIATRHASAPSAAIRAVAAGERSPVVLESPRADDAALDTGDAFALRGNPQRELVITANTRASSVAVYLDAWRHRIERIGTANYPLEAVRKAHLTGNPVLEVRVAADGRLVDAIVSRSSGHLEIDQAALNILRLAAPFEPFPANLAAEHDSVRLTYEWQFSNGEWTDSTVRAPANTH
jgi:periplasmic protein TonB